MWGNLHSKVPERVQKSRRRLKQYGVSSAYPKWRIENPEFSAHLLIPDLVGEPLVYVQGVTLKTIGIISYCMVANSPATWIQVVFLM